MRRFLARFGWPLVALVLLAGMITQWGLARRGPDRKVSPDEVRAVSTTLEAAASAYLTALLARDCGMAKALVLNPERDSPTNCRSAPTVRAHRLKTAPVDLRWLVHPLPAVE